MCDLEPAPIDMLHVKTSFLTASLFTCEIKHVHLLVYYYYYYHFTALWILSGTTQVIQYQKGKTKPNFLQQETVSGSGISWAICKSAPRPRQITMPTPHHSVFYRSDALPAPN